MALRKSSSRSIVIDGETYRWTVSDNIDVVDVTIQLAGGSGRKLVLHFSPQIRPEQSPPSVTPALVAQAVQLATASGWVPEESGPALHGRLNEGVLKTWTA